MGVRRQQYVTDELCRLFRERNVGWVWQAATLPAPPTGGPYAAEPSSARRSGGGRGEKFHPRSGGVDAYAGSSGRDALGLCVDVGSDDDGAGEDAAADGNHELLEMLLGAWVVVAVVGEEWDAAGGEGGSGGRGGHYRECRRLLHESNRFVLVVRLHRELPPEMLPVRS